MTLCFSPPGRRRSTDPDLRRYSLTVADPVSPALSGLLTRCAAKIRMAANRHGLGPGDLDDLTQEVRIRLWKALETGEKIEAVPASYVYQAAATAALDLIRQRRRAARAEPLSETAEQVATAPPQPDVVEAVTRAVAQLEPARRVAVRMYLQGYGYRDIADTLGWTEARARNLVYRGLGNVRDLLTVAEPAGGR